MGWLTRGRPTAGQEGVGRSGRTTPSPHTSSSASPFSILLGKQKKHPERLNIHCGQTCSTLTSSSLEKDNTLFKLSPNSYFIQASHNPYSIHLPSYLFSLSPSFFPFNLFNPFKFKDLKSKYYKR